jgi:hypothetical protein
MEDLEGLRPPHRRAPEKNISISHFARHRAEPRRNRGGGNRRRPGRTVLVSGFGNFPVAAGAIA